MTKNYFHGEWKKEYEPLLEEFDSRLKDKQYPVYARNMALTTDMIFTQPVCYEFQNLEMPVTLIIGLADKTAPGKERVSHEVKQRLGNYEELGKKTAKQIKHEHLVELAGIGHIPHIENFHMFAEKLDEALVSLNLQ